MSDVAQLAVDLENMINRARVALAEMAQAEARALDSIELVIRERLEAGQRFLDAFGHLVDDMESPAQVYADPPRDHDSLEQSFERLARDIVERMPPPIAPQGYR